MKKYKFMSLFCVLVIILSAVMPVVSAKEESSAVFANTLNKAMLENGVISTSERGGYVELADGYPNGVVYADRVNFTNGADPCLVIFRLDKSGGCVTADIYRYNGSIAKLVTSVSKPLNVASGNIAELALAEGGDYRYIVYNEYSGENLVGEEYYTVIRNNAFMRVEPPAEKTLFSVISFTSERIHPEVDISYYNLPLTKFFSILKDEAAECVEHEDILDNITAEEHSRISRVLSRAAGFTEEFDIGRFSEMSKYSLAVNEHDGEGKFNAITNIYPLGDEMYYIRYSTDLCFYNGTVVRRTDKVTDNYQILNVRNDFIPFTDKELDNLKEAYLKNRLVLEKSSGSMELKGEPIIEVNKLKIEKPLDVPQKLSPTLRKPIALIGGGVLLGLFVLLWVLFNSDKK